MAASSQLSLISAAFPHFETIFLPQLNADPQTNTHTFEVLLFERGPERRELRNCFAKAGTTPQTRGGTGDSPYKISVAQGPRKKHEGWSRRAAAKQKCFVGRGKKQHINSRD